jgi:hypothetical protein
MHADTFAKMQGQFSIPWGARVLFVLKHREVPGGYSCGGGMSSGLLNSAKFVADMLAAHGRRAKLVQVIDNNGIDREVTAFRPDIVIVEALWVVPEKFDVLKKLHPHVLWVIRNHSETPFLSVEGCAMERIIAYLGKSRVMVASNSQRCVSDMRGIAEAAYPHDHDAWARNVYLPNFYPSQGDDCAPPRRHWEVHVSCFGATRVLKNQLLQAAAAIKFANKEGLRLKFYMNTGRIEFTGDPVWKNIQALFEAMPQHELVSVPWIPHDEFLELMRKIDVSMQMSFSETMNIVTADAVNMGIPVVASPEIFWLDPATWADPNSGDSIAAKLREIWHDNALQRRLDLQRISLHRYSIDARRVWLGE